MTNATSWHVALVEDDDNLRGQLSEFLEGEAFSFGSVVVAGTGSFDSALSLLQQRKIDLIILDVFRGDVAHQDKAGADLLQSWKKTGFAPIILHTALPESLGEVLGPFVRLVPKGAGNFGAIRSEMEDLFRLRIPQLRRAIFDHLESSMRDYMWDFVQTHWTRIGELSARPDFARLLVNRLGHQFTRVGVGTVVREVYSGDAGVEAGPDKVHP